MLSFASAVASGLGDEVSDREGGKTTVATRAGNAIARSTSEVATFYGGVAWAIGSALSPSAPPVWTVAPSLLAVAAGYRGMRAWSGRAVTNAFPAQAVYKRHLHRAVWYGTTFLSVAILARAWLP
jgi:1,4-dihydroxy-2-naphthoate octaprenyltransferase/chlorophyll synthase